MAKPKRISFRASDELKQRLQRAAKKVKLDESKLAEAAVEAAVEYIERHGGIWLPLAVVPQLPDQKITNLPREDNPHPARQSPAQGRRAEK